MMAPIRLSILGVLLLLSLYQCDKEDHNHFNDPVCQFGEPIYDLAIDSVYYCETDGILKVDLQKVGESHSIGKPTGYIYSDENPEPETQVAIIYYSTTIPINKGMFWKIKKTDPNNYLISWTPILFN